MSCKHPAISITPDPSNPAREVVRCDSCGREKKRTAPHIIDSVAELVGRDILGLPAEPPREPKALLDEAEASQTAPENENAPEAP